jgi:hypothetical protein
VIELSEIRKVWEEMYIRSILCVLAFCLAAKSSSAAIIVSYQGNTIGYGSTGFVDVYVSSDAALATPDVLDSFSASFVIAPVGGAVSNGLQFVDPQSDTQLGQGNYVFAGNSITAPPIGTVSTGTNTNDSYIGGDATIDGLGTSLHAGSGSFLLYRLDLSALLANPSDQFTITLQNNLNTDFLDPSFTSLSINPSSFSSFTITAVPEPTSTGLLLAGAGVGLWLKRRKRQLEEGVA